jgi:hypothetical protein
MLSAFVLSLLSIGPKNTNALVICPIVWLYCTCLDCCKGSCTATQCKIVCIKVRKTQKPQKQKPKPFTSKDKSSGAKPRNSGAKLRRQA